MTAIEQRLTEIERERVGLLEELGSLKHAALGEGRMAGLDRRRYPETPDEKVALFERMFVAHFVQRPAGPVRRTPASRV